MKRLLAILLLATARLAFADCPAGQPAASCTLHEEGVAAFTAGKYDEAATKFRAAIAAGPTARSYLGYSQAIEEQKKIALAYETMLLAQRLSNAEVTADAGKDPAIAARAERIKYKLAELRSKIAYVWLRVPEGVPARRLVSIYREGEGDLEAPLGRWIVVAPGRQVMYATLDDGNRIEVVAAVAAGGQSSLVIPIPAARPALPPPELQPQPQSAFVPPPADTGPPAAAAGPPDPANLVFALDAVFVVRDAEAVGKGLGFGALFERKVHPRFAATARAAIAFHPSQDTETDVQTSTASANEWLLMAGARTRSKLPLYASFELGVLGFNARTKSSPIVGTEATDDYSHLYAAVLVGGGLRLGKVHFEGYVLATPNNGDNFDLPTRIFLTFGIDLLRR